MTILAPLFKKDDQNQANQPPPGPAGYAMPMGNPVWMFGEAPMPLVCPNCRKQVVSRVEKKSGILTWLICLGIAILGSPLGCFLGCCLIPFCIDGGKVKYGIEILLIVLFFYRIHTTFVRTAPPYSAFTSRCNHRKPLMERHLLLIFHFESF